MEQLMERVKSHISSSDIRSFALQTSYQVACYPMHYAKTLIQIGYEPIQPVKRSFFGKPYLALPNIFQYIKYIKTVDGFVGCYRGLLPYLCQNTVASFVHNQVAIRYPFVVDDEPSTSREAPPITIRNDSMLGQIWTSGRLETTLKRTGWQLVCTSASIAASQPFYVIMVRTVGQFVGRETKYSSIWESILTIFEEEGINGFFVGLIPRLVGEIILVSVSATMVYLINSYVGKTNQTVDQGTNMAANVVAHAMSYQFSVVASTMAVNNRLAIGRHPHTIKFSNWVDCWSYLREMKQLKRGSSIIGRYYMGPFVVLGGEKLPSGFFFGPHHAPPPVNFNVSNPALGIPNRFPNKTD